MNYFKKDYIVNISSLINRELNFYAHVDENRKETLQEHIDLCNKYFDKINKSKEMGRIFKNFEDLYLNDLDEEYILLFRKLVINTINFHDIGKINPEFQHRKMNNKILDKSIFEGIKDKHSIISSVLYINYFIDEIDNIKKVNKAVGKKLSQILFLNGYIISRHHSKLSDFEEFVKSFDEDYCGDADKVISSLNNSYNYVYNKEFNRSTKVMLKKCRNVKKTLIKNSKEESIYVYTYVKLLFSLLVACDFYATTEFMNNLELNEFGEISDISNFYDLYKESEIYKSIRNYEKNEYKKENDLKNENDINVLRTEMFLDAENELFRNLNSDIFFLEAPTGSGKSNVSINLSFKLLEENKSMNKIYYIYPFNTLIEQNISSLEMIFINDVNPIDNVFNNIAVVNSINPIKVENEKDINEDITEEFDYKYYAKALLDRQFLNYPMILTTHVSLFNTMFDSRKESLFSFHQLANSVIVLDEIQSYKNTIWSEIITFLKGFSKILNMKVIIMSATLPNLNYLTDSDEDTTTLIKDREKYFSNPLFKDRVVVNYDLIEKEIEEIYDHVKNSSLKGKKILVEFIKKQSAYEFYNKLKEDEEINSKIELITGDDNSIERQRIINIAKNSNNIILIATQVIEAGVDIDMDIGYKDISKLDSDEQFMGRINRSCKKSGIVYFFNVDKADLIYKNDIRMNKKFTLEDENMKKILVNKYFKDYYLPILKALKTYYNDSLSELNLNEFFSEDVGGLKFDKITSRMKLIEEDMWSISVYLSRNIEKEDGTILYGNEIWDSYKTILLDKNLDYAKRQIKLSEARSLLNYFIYQVKKCDLIYNDRIGDLYFIEDGEKYFRDGKVDKEKLITGIGDFI
ncbi:CRISPR-associated helicase Cas3' [Romboutsia ilealis]|uniref:CRISPR-associated helicase Cas3 n=1 Tax=Romboutsia faecis TaxID=2764597 RepID=A0ABR7JSB5_9FIRM|nr:CRISPR-associated helicase Cas3' [Romboutsia faecis]MBC5997672.1 CRISPR-associated helicase Cas3' [Romboutsia faecis]MRN25379.1 CRISPR-associated helicase Cas3' [Romboutsia ilealis]